MAMSTFYKMLNGNTSGRKSFTNNTESVITQVQKPSENTTPKAAAKNAAVANSKSVNLLTKYIPSLVVSCLTRKNQPKECEGGFLLAKQAPVHKGKKTLVLDLDETLVHSSFEKVANPDLTMSLMIRGTMYNFSVMVRPGTEEFLTKACEMFEVVIYTASLMEYAQALMKLLHKTDLKYKILAREHCTLDKGAYVKDLARLGRDLKDVILVDNSPNAFRFNPENAYHIKDFFDDKKDTELFTLMNCLEYMSEVSDVRPVKTHRSACASQASSQKSISTQSSIKSARGSDYSIVKTDGNIYQLQKTPKVLAQRNSNAGESEAALIIRNMMEKKKQIRNARPEDVKTNLLSAKVRTTDVSTAGKTDDGLEDVTINQRGSVETVSTDSRGSSENLNDSVGEEKKMNERIFHAIEARAC